MIITCLHAHTSPDSQGRVSYTLYWLDADLPWDERPVKARRAEFLQCPKDDYSKAVADGAAILTYDERSPLRPWAPLVTLTQAQVAERNLC